MKRAIAVLSPRQWPQRLPVIVLLAGITTIPGLALIVQRVRLLLNGGGSALFGDGLNLWSGAHLALAGQLDIVFDPQKYGLWFAHHFGGDLHSWSYPPSYLLFALPFGVLPPAASLAAFDLVSFCCLLLALRVSGFGWPITIAVLFCPAALTSVGGSQNGAFIAGFLIAGLFLSETRPWSAGILIGFATIKPQLGLLIPVYWLARGNWRSIISASLTALLLIFASSLAFSPESWVLFCRKVVPFMNGELLRLTAKARLGPRPMIMSSFSLSRELGLNDVAARSLQLLTSAGAVLASWTIGRHRALSAQDKPAWIMLLNVLASPYIWCYDMIPASLSVALLVRSGLRTGFFKGELIILTSLWLMPGIALNAAAAGWPTFVPVLVILTLAYAWFHLRHHLSIT